MDTVEKIAPRLQKEKITSKAIIDIGAVSELDSLAAIYIAGILKKCQMTPNQLQNSEKYQKIIEFYFENHQEEATTKPQKEGFFEDLGRWSVAAFSTFNQFLVFIGELFFHLFWLLKTPSKIRFKEVAKQIDDSAYKALVIVVVTAFLVGVVIAYQGAVQLEKFGANIFIVEMIAISMFREIAPLITAIVIAGRSASSYTAEIGAMKITDEIDAMKTMGFEPALFITLPRMLALAISLPLLVFLADIVGVLGGMVVSFLSLDITFVEFTNRLQNEVGVEHLFIGIFKSVVFGIFIALIACFRGFQVQNNTTSIGKYTTISVVNAIFMVILLDALFSIIFTKMGI